ncbi:exodeoxyribonuclease VII large subunit [Pseudoalteromonas aurantia]|uniref:Exodeoxyribonuclease 7 large subunit n=1 Tax=Pseudoalteromonas aurantia TaxID=43654 RepID=A0A5S3VD26_9GAMM|nr:exodeoxyribonuclease VII large subunit [Pseudoalteromonas aurantia]TMO60614.1 exodeoxyribonuclease VII large subunit [Pseudoalteromonas aurantia]TMO70092.1 exodeoxyribonuclease VII large subunit [Pseudoalteromonas aurantia]TMO76117.1 exodeoxyribonuclease VII large subunit [Pseudoalteromonas aurantia]
MALGETKLSYQSRSTIPQHIYTVSRLNKEIRAILEQGFAQIQLTGEISNFVAPASGHWYFSLKDEKAQVKAAMWRGNNRNCSYRPVNGAQVTLRARISVYEPRGDYQVIVEHMEAAGEGLLKQQYDALKLKLAAEGLFGSAHKKSLPAHINKVGIITSATGAAVKDILSVLQRRAPQLEVIIYPAQVQGKDAHFQLIEKLQLANKRNEVDVLIIGRGGGSLEDLWCFNEELLARAIFASNLPIISAVGHEIDTTISDYTADLRAATPSAAAELVSSEQDVLIDLIANTKQQLKKATNNQINYAKQRTQNLTQRLRLQHPKNQLMQQSQRIDELSLRLQRAFEQRHHLLQGRMSLLEQKLSHQHPNGRITQAKQGLNQLMLQLRQLQKQHAEARQNKLAFLAATLNSVSPLSVLARGYSITKTNNKVIKSISQLQEGQVIQTQLNDGEISSQITQLVSKTQSKEIN